MDSLISSQFYNSEIPAFILRITCIYWNSWVISWSHFLYILNIDLLLQWTYIYRLFRPSLEALKLPGRRCSLDRRSTSLRCSLLSTRQLELDSRLCLLHNIYPDTLKQHLHILQQWTQACLWLKRFSLNIVNTAVLLLCKPFITHNSTVLSVHVLCLLVLWTWRAVLCSMWLWGTAPTLPSWLRARMWCLKSTKSLRRWRASVMWVNPTGRCRVIAHEALEQVTVFNREMCSRFIMIVLICCRKSVAVSGRATQGRPSQMWSMSASEDLILLVQFIKNIYFSDVFF